MMPWLIQGGVGMRPRSATLAAVDYVTFDAARKGSAIVLSSGNRVATINTAATWNCAMCLNGKSSGKWYAEFVVNKNVSNACAVGIGNASTNLGDFMGRTADGYCYYENGSVYNNNTGTAYGPSFPSGTIIGIAWDADNRKVWFSKAGVFTGNPVAGTGAAYTGIPAGAYYCGVTIYGNNSDNGNAVSSTYAPPSGFSQWT